jgi:hypothetical protein
MVSSRNEKERSVARVGLVIRSATKPNVLNCCVPSFSMFHLSAEETGPDDIPPRPDPNKKWNKTRKGISSFAVLSIMDEE